MAGTRRKGLNQDLQNWGIGKIRAVVGNSSVVQTVRPEIDQETDCKTIGVRQPKIGDRPNLMGCGPEWGCVSGYLRATTPDAGCTPRWHGRRKFMPSLQSQGDRADGPPRAVGKDTSRDSRGGQIFLLHAIDFRLGRLPFARLLYEIGCWASFAQSARALMRIERGRSRRQATPGVLRGRSA